MYIECLSSQYDNFFKAVTAGGWANESSGNVEAPSGWFAKTSISAVERFELLKAFEDEFNQIEMPIDEKRNEVIGFFGCEINEQGFIWVYRFASQGDLDAWYLEKDEAFSKWDNS